MDEKKVNETALEPFQKEENWLAISITLAIIAVVIGGFGLLWIFDIGPINNVDDRIKVATLVGGGLLALITYSTVIWRGLVGARQADQQKDENTATLLLEGAKIVCEDNLTYASAGIAALDTVIKSGNPKFSARAVDLLADVAIETVETKDKRTLYFEALRSLRTSFFIGISSSRELRINKTARISEEEIALGFKRVVYLGATFNPEVFVLIHKNQRSAFAKCNFFDTQINQEGKLFSECDFLDCEIASINKHSLENNRYYNCDFTSSIINHFRPTGERKSLLNSTFDNCFYYRGSPPTGNAAHLILPYLVERDRHAT